MFVIGLKKIGKKGYEPDYYWNPNTLTDFVKNIKEALIYSDLDKMHRDWIKLEQGVVCQIYSLIQVPVQAISPKEFKG